MDSIKLYVPFFSILLGLIKRILVQSIGILTRDFGGEFNFLIPLLRRSFEKLKTEFLYPHPLPFGRHLEKRGDFLFFFNLVNGQFL